MSCFWLIVIDFDWTSTTKNTFVEPPAYKKSVTFRLETKSCRILPYIYGTKYDMI